LEILPKKPILTVAQAAAQLKLTKPAISKAIQVLVACTILVEATGKKRNQQYRYQGYLDILTAEPE